MSQKGGHVKLRRGAAIVIVPVHPGKDLKVGLVRAILRSAGTDPARWR